MTLYGICFYLIAALILMSTGLAVSRRNPVHAVVYLILSFLGSAMLFYLFGAPFLAALEVIIYAGAIMVIFVFVIMMLNQGQKTVNQERVWLTPGMWIGPSLLALVLLGEVLVVIAAGGTAETGQLVNSKQVGVALYGPYLLAVELASMLLLAGLVGAYHLGKPMIKKTRQGRDL